MGQKPSKIERDENGKIKTNITPQLELSVPIMFSAMSYGSISYNAMKVWRERRRSWESIITLEKAGYTKIFISTAPILSCR